MSQGHKGGRTVRKEMEGVKGMNGQNKDRGRSAEKEILVSFVLTVVGESITCLLPFVPLSIPVHAMG